MGEERERGGRVVAEGWERGGRGEGEGEGRQRERGSRGEQGSHRVKRLCID